jgi:thiol-disulfide isomerase/thioredoxin
MKKSLIIWSLLLLFATGLKAQKQFSTQIRFPTGIIKNKVEVFFDDGKERYAPVKLNFNKNTVVISNTYYSKFATIFVSYKGDSLPFYHTFWVTNKPSKIIFSADKFQKAIRIATLKNAFDVEEMGEKALNIFVAKESKDFKDFLTKYGNKWTSSSELIHEIEGLNQKLINKKLEFIRKHKDDYYSLFLFRNSIMGSGNNQASIDTLKKIFKTTFSDNFKNSKEGVFIESYLDARSLKSMSKAPNFNTIDIHKKPISLEKLQNKYVLLVFWATWCGPCVAEIPQIKEIRKLNSVDKLEIISVSLDSDFSKYTAGLKKYQMDWTQIYGDNDLVNTYGVTGIPVVYLIDKSGKIIYSRDEEKDNSLTVLTKLLAESL